jgi:predicted nuclease of predicted toxin-antitoxin system
MPWKPLPSPPKGWISANRERRAKFLVDESLGVDVAKVLRARGWNAVYASDLKLLGRSDEDVFAAARREDRILLTHDRDFLNDRVFRMDVNPGVAILPGAEGDNAALGRALHDLVDVVGPFRETFRGAKIIVRPDRTLTVSQRTYEGRVKTTKYRLSTNRQPEQWED